MDGGQDTLPTIVDFDGLLTNLDRQSGLYDALLRISDRERTAIGQADLTQLAALVAAKERMVIEAQALERCRAEACERWGRARGMDHAPSIGEMRLWLDAPDQAARLDAATVKLSQRVNRLRQANGRNKHVIQQAQRMNENLIAAALRHTQHPVYSNQGDALPDQRRSLIFDYRV